MVSQENDFIIKLKSINLQAIPSEKITKKQGIYYYETNPIELIPFLKKPIHFDSRLIKYLTFINSCRNEFTVQNFLGYTNFNSFYYFILEAKPQNSLISQLERMSNYQKLLILLKVAEIIQVFHLRNMALPNISTPGIFVENNKVTMKVINLKRVVQECSLENNFKMERLYYEYLPPDLFNECEYSEDLRFTKEGNIWSLGTIVSEIFSHSKPWVNKYKDNEAILNILLVKKTEFPIPSIFENECHQYSQILRNCLNIKPEMRGEITKIVEMIKKLKKNKENIFTIIALCKVGILKKIEKKNILIHLGKFM